MSVLPIVLIWGSVRGDVPFLERGDAGGLGDSREENFLGEEGMETDLREAWGEEGGVGLAGLAELGEERRPLEKQ